MTEIVYYISGPMTGLPEFNFPAFATAASHLRATGMRVVSAHEIKHNDDGKPGSLAWADYVRGDLIAMLQQCNAIVMLPGWNNSKGAKLELQIAQALEWPAYMFLPNERRMVTM